MKTRSSRQTLQNWQKQRDLRRRAELLTDGLSQGLQCLRLLSSLAWDPGYISRKTRLCVLVIGIGPQAISQPKDTAKSNLDPLFANPSRGTSDLGHRLKTMSFWVHVERGTTVIGLAGSRHAESGCRDEA